MVIPVVFLLIVVVSPTAAVTLNTDEAFNARIFDAGGIGGISGGGDGNLGLGLIAGPLLAFALLAALAGSTNTGATAVPGTTTILRQVPTPRVCPICPTMTATVCPTLTPCYPMPACPANYERLGIPAGVAGAGTILQSCYRVITGALTYAAGAQQCAADNGAPAEFNTVGEIGAVQERLAGLPGTFYTGHTDAYGAAGVILGMNSGLPAVGVVFPAGVGAAANCGTITAVGGAAPASPLCTVASTGGIVCEISLAASTCFCPAGTG